MAGHSKWANIKHKKAREDAKKGKVWSKCARAIMAAARAGGGNPETNLTLRYALEEAKAANMPKDTRENAIRKATGEAGGAAFEQAVYEGYGPAGVAVLLEILTDNRNRTAGEVRKIFERHGGNLGESGCVAYLFTSRGQIFVPKEGPGEDEETVMTAALEAGADDVADEGDAWQVLTEPTALLGVREAMEAAALPIAAAAVTMLPQTTTHVAGNDAAKVLALVDALEDHDDVQKVYANFEIPDEELAALES
ncbi:MAG: YebC/PmpR family DNA-binding transcriptional regulator [Phycisphaeraceae bacterium]